MRNSSVSVTVVVLTEGPLLFEDVVVEEGFLFSSVLLEMDELEYTRAGVKFADGFSPAPCWMSLPWLATSAGASVASFFRSCGVILERTRSLTGCLLLDSEYMSMSKTNSSSSVSWATSGTVMVPLTSSSSFVLPGRSGDTNEF